MTTIITFTKPMAEFKDFFANGIEVAENVDLSQCDQFWAKGTNAELLIYSGSQLVYSCCYTEAYEMLFVTSVWSHEGCMFQKPVDYDAIEKSLQEERSLANAHANGQPAPRRRTNHPPGCRCHPASGQ